MKQQVVFAHEIPDSYQRPSIFLAGPTPRVHSVPTWRTEALRFLLDARFEGNVFVPETRDGIWDQTEYDKQVEWEWSMLHRTTIIAFWIPRDMETLPGMTTNVEFGMYCASGKVVAGAPTTAVKNRYLIKLANRNNIPWVDSLPHMLTLAVTSAVDRFQRLAQSYEDA